jgi:uncharacterized membrane protein
MSSLLRCKTCGFIIEADKLGDVCPACGVPRTLFEPYADKVSPKRRVILDSHLHPVAVHLPQAFAFAIFAFGLALLAVDGEARKDLEITVTVMAWCLPFLAAAGIASGIFDGLVRFRKVSTPALTKKIVFGSAFLVLSVVLAILTGLGGFSAIAGFTYWVIGLGLACLGCGAILGLIGGTLIHSAFPG